MPHELDNKLREICTPQEILRIYIQYKKAKLDRLLSRSVPTYVESETAGGRSNRNRALSVIEVMSLPDYIANFPAWDTKKDRHGNERKIIRIPMGSDGVNYRMFEKDMERNVNEIASRIQSGKYLFRPLRDVVSLKPKYDDGTRLTKQELLLAQKDGRTRTLTIATIRDAIVQRLLHKVLGEYLEKRFFSRLDYPYPVSFAYRPGKSAVRAAQMVLKHVNEGFSHVLDADLSRFFDSIPRDALINRCSQVLGDNPLTFSLLRRFICIDRVDYFSYHWAGNSKGERIGEKIFQMQKSELTIR